MYHNISIIIPTLGSVESLSNLFRSISSQQFDLRHIEVLLIVNGLNSLNHKYYLNELVKLYPNIKIKLFFLEAKGVNRARNEGIKQSEYGVLLFLDDDCVLQRRQFLKAHLQYHNDNKLIFAYGGGYQLPVSSGFFDELYHDIQMRWLLSGVNLDFTSSHLIGGNFSLKKSLLMNLNFDENIVYGGSEFDFFKRASFLNYSIIYNDLDVIHFTNESFFSLVLKLYKQGRGKAYIDSKFGPKNDSYKSIEQKGPLFLLFRIIFNYIFWFGYYSYLKKRRYLVKHVLKDIIQKINFIRYKILNKTTEKIQLKKEKGERF